MSHMGHTHIQVYSIFYVLGFGYDTGYGAGSVEKKMEQGGAAGQESPTGRGTRESHWMFCIPNYKHIEHQ